MAAQPPPQPPPLEFRNLTEIQFQQQQQRQQQQQSMINNQTNPSFASTSSLIPLPRTSPVPFSVPPVQIPSQKLTLLEYLKRLSQIAITYKLDKSYREQLTNSLAQSKTSEITEYFRKYWDDCEAKSLRAFPITGHSVLNFITTIPVEERLKMVEILERLRQASSRIFLDHAPLTWFGPKWNKEDVSIWADYVERAQVALDQWPAITKLVNPPPPSVPVLPPHQVSNNRLAPHPAPFISLSQPLPLPPPHFNNNIHPQTFLPQPQLPIQSQVQRSTPNQTQDKGKGRQIHPPPPPPMNNSNNYNNNGNNNGNNNNGNKLSSVNINTGELVNLVPKRRSRSKKEMASREMESVARQKDMERRMAQSASEIEARKASLSKQATQRKQKRRQEDEGDNSSLTKERTKSQEKFRIRERALVLAAEENEWNGDLEERIAECQFMRMVWSFEDLIERYDGMREEVEEKERKLIRIEEGKNNRQPQLPPIPPKEGVQRRKWTEEEEERTSNSILITQALENYENRQQQLQSPYDQLISPYNHPNSIAAIFRRPYSDYIPVAHFTNWTPNIIIATSDLPVPISFRPLSVLTPIPKSGISVSLPITPSSSQQQLSAPAKPLQFATVVPIPAPGTGSAIIHSSPKPIRLPPKPPARPHSHSTSSSSNLAPPPPPPAGSSTYPVMPYPPISSSSQSQSRFIPIPTPTSVPYSSGSTAATTTAIITPLFFHSTQLNRSSTTQPPPPLPLLSPEILISTTTTPTPTPFISRMVSEKETTKKFQVEVVKEEEIEKEREEMEVDEIDEIDEIDELDESEMEVVVAKDLVVEKESVIERDVVVVEKVAVVAEVKVAEKEVIIEKEIQVEKEKEIEKEKVETAIIVKEILSEKIPVTIPRVSDRNSTPPRPLPPSIAPLPSLPTPILRSPAPRAVSPEGPPPRLSTPHTPTSTSSKVKESSRTPPRNFSPRVQSGTTTPLRPLSRAGSVKASPSSSTSRAIQELLVRPPVVSTSKAVTPPPASSSVIEVEVAPIRTNSVLSPRQSMPLKYPLPSKPTTPVQKKKVVERSNTTVGLKNVEPQKMEAKVVAAKARTPPREVVISKEIPIVAAQDQLPIPPVVNKGTDASKKEKKTIEVVKKVLASTPVTVKPIEKGVVVEKSVIVEKAVVVENHVSNGKGKGKVVEIARPVSIPPAPLIPATLPSSLPNLNKSTTTVQSKSSSGIFLPLAATITGPIQSTSSSPTKSRSSVPAKSQLSSAVHTNSPLPTSLSSNSISSLPTFKRYSVGSASTTLLPTSAATPSTPIVVTTPSTAPIIVDANSSNKGKKRARESTASVEVVAQSIKNKWSLGNLASTPMKPFGNIGKKKLKK